MQMVTVWLRRRPATILLITFFTIWYALELVVLHLVGGSAARWWFYLEQPPNHISPGLLLAPISHDLHTVTHIGSNVALLLFAGGVAEPYVGWRRVLLLVVGAGFIGTYVANMTVLFHQVWIVAGASGGILALWAYSGFRLGRQAVVRTLDRVEWSRRQIETGGMVMLLVGTPGLLYQQVVLIDQPHSGHVIGLLLGCLYYGIETVVGGVADSEHG